MSVFKDLSRTLRAAVAGEGFRGRLARGTVGVLSARVSGRMLALISSVVLARALGPNGLGMYSFAVSVVLLLIPFSTLGFPELLVRELATLSDGKHWARLRGLLRGADVLTGLASLALSLLGIASLILLGARFSSYRAVLFWASALLPVLAFERLRASDLRGLRRVALAEMPSILRSTIVVVGVIGAYWLFPDSITPSGAMAIHIAAGVTAFVVGSVWLVRSLPPGSRDTSPVYETRSWFMAAVPFLGLSVLFVANSQATTLLLGILGTAADVGLYRVALALGAVVPFFLESANTVISPEVARLYARRDSETLRHLITSHARMTLLATLPVVGIILLLGPLILEVAYGPDFASAFQPLVVIALGQLVNVSFGPVGPLLNMTGNVRRTVRALSLSVVWLVAANVVLIPALGPLGAAVAYSSALVLWNVLLLRAVRRILQLDPTALGRRISG